MLASLFTVRIKQSKNKNTFICRLANYLTQLYLSASDSKCLIKVQALALTKWYERRLQLVIFIAYIILVAAQS